MAATAPGEGLLTAPAPAVGAVETENPERGETPREASSLRIEGGRAGLAPTQRKSQNLHFIVFILSFLMNDIDTDI